MRLRIVAAFALAAASSAQAQTTPATDLSTATPVEGSWNYAATATGSQATFVGATGLPQLTIRCMRATRQLTIAKPATGAAPFLVVWTSTQTRNLPASYNPATRLISAAVSAYDPLLDAMAFSRGRLGFSAWAQPTLVVPAWAEVARVVEDCRA